VKTPGRLLGAAVERPRRALVGAVLLTLIGVWGASTLRPGSPQSLLAKPHSATAAATRSHERAFGAEPIVVSLQGDLTTTLAAPNLVNLLALERQIASLRGVQAVFGPGTFIQQTVNQIDGVIRQDLIKAGANAAGAVATHQQLKDLLVRYGYIGVPSITNDSFVGQLVFGSGTEPKQRFAWLFPDARHALVLVRPRAGLSDPQTRALGSRIEQLVKAAPLQDVQPLVAGAPLVAAGVSDQFSRELLRLAPVLIGAMALVLLIGLGLRIGSLLLLVPAGVAVLLTASLSAGLGLGLTPATVAALPVILGLAIDYAVQLQARYWDRRFAGVAMRQAALSAAVELGPTLLLAGGSMAAGFLALSLSGVPLVSLLGLTLAIGVGCSLLVVLVFAPSLLACADRLGAPPPQLPVPRRITVSRRAPILGLAAAGAAALGGLALSAGASVQSDLGKLAPGGMTQLRNVERLEQELGTSGQLRVAIHARDVTNPAVLQWMEAVQGQVLALDNRLRPGPNLAAILSTGAGGSIPSQADVQSLLTLVPAYFTAAVLSPDHTRAELSFGVPLIPGDDQARLVDRIKRVLSRAPAGVSAQPAGLIALSAASVEGLQAGRPWLLLLAALIMFSLLFVVRRRLDRAIIPIVPALLGAGFSALIVAATGIRLSPLGAGLDPLVLAVGVGFGVLLDARYHEAREAGHSETVAARLAARHVGAPVAVAAATVALGFATLIASRFNVLVQFGALAAVEVLLCALAAILIVPALAAAFDRARTGSPPRGLPIGPAAADGPAAGVRSRTLEQSGSASV
jgi:predicted RND superfamily exporter protein